MLTAKDTSSKILQQLLLWGPLSGHAVFALLRILFPEAEKEGMVARLYPRP